jgi:hypothetical protein
MPDMLRSTAEHLKARCEGGTNARDNIVAAHHICNARRHKRKRAPQPSEFRELVRKRVANGRWFDAATLNLLHRWQEDLPKDVVGASLGT